QDPEPPNWIDAVQAPPPHRGPPRLKDSRSDQATNQRMTRAGRQTTPPSEQVPCNRAAEPGADNGDHFLVADLHDPSDSVRDRGAEEDGSDDVKGGCQWDRLRGPGDARCYEGRDGGRRIMTAIGEGEDNGH